MLRATCILYLLTKIVDNFTQSYLCPLCVFCPVTDNVPQYSVFFIICRTIKGPLVAYSRVCVSTVSCKIQNFHGCILVTNKYKP